MFGCYNCQKESELKRCSKCKQASYCSVECQSQHWPKHKPNCIPSDSSLHHLFTACSLDLFPDRPTSFDYGFDNVAKYHKGFLTPDRYTAGQILLGLYQCIRRDVCALERPHEPGKILNKFGASKKMMVKAYESNGLDEFLHRYIKNVIQNYGTQSPSYCLIWAHNKLIIGPTRVILSNSKWLTEEKIMEIRNEFLLKHYGK